MDYTCQIDMRGRSKHPDNKARLVCNLKGAFMKAGFIASYCDDMFLLSAEYPDLIKTLDTLPNNASRHAMISAHLNLALTKEGVGVEPTLFYASFCYTLCFSPHYAETGPISRSAKRLFGETMGRIQVRRGLAR